MTPGLTVVPQAAPVPDARIPWRTLSDRNPQPALDVTVARTETDLRAVARLLESLYAARGYLVAAEDGDAMGTLTLRVDGPLGLRADESYGDEYPGSRSCRRGRLLSPERDSARLRYGASYGHASARVAGRRRRP